MDRVVPDPQKSIREGAIAPWNSPSYAHELEELLALADDYNLPVDVPYCRAHRTNSDADHRRRAGAKLRRPQRLLPLAGAAQIQDAPAGVLEPLAVVLALPGVQRRATAARSAGRARRRQELCRRVPHENPRGARVLRGAAIARMAAADRPAAGRGCALAAGVPGRRRRRLSRARPAAANAQRRRSAARRADRDARLEPGRHAVRARRAVGRPAPGRRRAAGRRRSSSCTSAATRWSSSSTKRKSFAGPTRSWSSAPARATTAAASCFKARRKNWRTRTDSRTGDWLAGRRGVGSGAAPLDRARLDQAPRRARQQSAECHGRVSARRAVPGDGRQRRGQEHARRQNALPGPRAPAAQRRATQPSCRSRWSTTTCSAPGSSKTWSTSTKARSAARRDRIRPRTSRRSIRSACCLPSSRMPAPAASRPAISASTSKAAAATRATATATWRSTCSSWPTCT